VETIFMQTFNYNQQAVWLSYSPDHDADARITPQRKELDFLSNLEPDICCIYKPIF
jgi:hypothetical protein